MINGKDIQIRDPFIVPVEQEGKYYLFGTTDRDPWNTKGTGFDCYFSVDLIQFEGPFEVFSPPEGFWGTHDFWAPELHYYRDNYYLFASFKSDCRRRGTQILTSTSILGPFEPLGNRALTPGNHECLDGTLHIDEKGNPWMVFCHEWLQINDGAVLAMPLSNDLSDSAGEPVLLFHASEASWPRPLERRDGSGIRDAYVTDGPFLHRQRDGKLLILWSSMGEKGYAMGCAVSDGGSVTGPWRQIPEPLVPEDGGHGMVFRDFSGRLQVTWHTPNKTPLERFTFREVRESSDGLIF